MRISTISIYRDIRADYLIPILKLNIYSLCKKWKEKNRYKQIMKHVVQSVQM